jgi:hypothetical protein
MPIIHPWHCRRPARPAFVIPITTVTVLVMSCHRSPLCRFTSGPIMSANYNFFFQRFVFTENPS